VNIEAEKLPLLEVGDLIFVDHPASDGWQIARVSVAMHDFVYMGVV